MASTRKLQGEIDRVLKQITEHMQEFDQIWQKVHSAPTPNLKEKYEGDLKKEIKKLQRFRDQLKSWAANSDIKNKKPLLDARKAIENEMERFKVLEKETKTKAYSKEGLSGHGRGGRGRAGSSDSNHQDPREDPAKRDTFVWLDNVEESLANQLAELEEKADTLRANSKKKKSSGTDQLLDEITHKCERHQWHIDTLQTIKDRLEHDELAVALVEDIRDDLEYYLNSNQEADFQEDETLYDALELDKEVERLDSRDEEATEPADEDDMAADADDAAADEDDAPAQDEEELEEEDESEERGTVSAILKSAGAKSTPTKAKAAASAGKAAGGKAAAAPSLSAAAVVKGRSNSNASAGPTPVVPTPSPSAAAGKGESLASILMKQKQAAAAAAAPSPSSSPSPSAAGAAAKVGAKAPTAAAPTGPQPVSAASLDQFMADAKKMATKPAGVPVQGPTGQQQQQQQQQQPKSLPPGVMPSIAPAQLGRLPPGTKPPPGTQQSPAVQPMMPPPGLSSQTPPPGLGLGTGVGGAGSGSAAEMSGLPPSTLLSSSANTGASGAPTGVKDRTLVPDDYLLTLSLMEPSLRNLPDPFDSERPKQYVPRNPYRTPSYFPSLPAPIFDDPALFDKLSVDTLFFIFYFQQGTPHQYLAARELKKQSWRYHKNFLTWFQRHDDPKITTEEFEQGTYVYFDYESGWCQRIKADFTFEYRHLEDELAVPLAATL